MCDEFVYKDKNLDLCLQICLAHSINDDIEELKLTISAMSVFELNGFMTYINLVEKDDVLENISLYKKLRNDIRKILKEKR